MSPEEFDNRLRSSFNDEFVPPKEHLWHNINTRLDQKARKPIWYWLAPVLIVATAAISWLGYSAFLNNDKANTSTKLAANSSTSAQSADVPSKDQSSNAIADNSTAANNAVAEQSDLTSRASQNSENNKASSNESTDKAVTEKTYSEKNNLQKSQKVISNNSSASKTAIINEGSDNISNIVKHSTADKTTNKLNLKTETDENNQSVFSRLFFVKRFKRNFSVELLTKASLSPIIWPVIKAPGKGQHTAEDMAWGGNFEDNKWWLNFGFGNQVAYNRFHATYDSVTKNKIHRHLIDKEKELTHNGGGFQMHLNLQNKFGKGNRFSFETGINYSFRTEDIKMNEQTYDIAARNNSDDILSYLRLKLFIAVGTDTTFFDATQSFALITKNKYSIITVPLRFQYEQPLNRNTFLSLGVGGGASILKNNATTHYDMVKEKDFQKSSSKYLTGSLNTIVSLYTNYNGIGQFGVYGGYQMYLTPFKVNEQYGVSMSDLQFGVLFRRPLDLK